MNIKLLAQANTLIKQSKFDEAEKIYLDMLIKSPDDPILQAFLGRVYIKKHKYKRRD